MSASKGEGSVAVQNTLSTSKAKAEKEDPACFSEDGGWEEPALDEDVRRVAQVQTSEPHGHPAAFQLGAPGRVSAPHGPRFHHRYNEGFE